jgi:hypothetical protein
MLIAGTFFGFGWSAPEAAYAGTSDGATIIDVSDSTTESGTGWTYANNIFTIADGANVTITGSTTTNRVVVASGATATITLENATIDRSSNNYSAFDISGATVTLILSGTNVLKGGIDNFGCAGLNVPGVFKYTLVESSLTITSIDGDGSTNGELTSIGGGTHGAGIGGGGNGGDNSAGTITINGGTIIATGAASSESNDQGRAGAGIGGGAYQGSSAGNGGTITINGGKVIATGGDGYYGGAGIGGGSSRDKSNAGGGAGTIAITGGEVIAVGGKGASGIGGARLSTTSGSITITGGTIIAMGGVAMTRGPGEGISTTTTTGTSQMSGFNGIIIDAKTTGRIVGNVVLPYDFTIPSTATLTIEEDASLTVPYDVIFTVDGDVINEGTFTNNGIMVGDGTFTGIDSHKVSYSLADTNFLKKDDLAIRVLREEKTKGSIKLFEGSKLPFTAVVMDPDNAFIYDWKVNGVSSAETGDAFTLKNITEATDIALSIAGVKLSVTSTTSLDFGTVNSGYLEEDLSACNIAFMNDNDFELKGVRAVFSGKNSAAFVAKGRTASEDLDAGASKIVSIIPELGLPLGEYEATLTVTNSTTDKVQTINITFVVSNKDFVISATDSNAPAPVRGTDFSYVRGLLTIKSGKAMTVRLIDNTFVAKQDKILVAAKEANITLDDVIIDASDAANACALNVDGGTLNLTLSGENELHSAEGKAGLQLSNGANLIIPEESEGSSLVATTVENAAGIGGGLYTADAPGKSGDITIHGGDITATNKGGIGAGIGGGGAYSSVGDITVTGGTINATVEKNVSSMGGAGIGGGIFYSSAGDITITDGTVSAQAGRNGAGIGGGMNYSSVGDIKISGGKVTATRTTDAAGGAGIGGGNIRSGAEDITITGGEVTATNNSTSYGAGIGAGSGTDVAPANVGDIYISGGTVVGWSEGLPENDIGSSRVATAKSVTIDGGTVYAKNGTVAPTPKNSDGDTVYANKLTLGGEDAAEDTAITAGIIAGVASAETPNAKSGVYGIKDVKTNGDSAVCFWLPAFSAPARVALGTNDAAYQKIYASKTVQTQTLAEVGIQSVNPSGAASASGNMEITFDGPMDKSYKGSVSLAPEDDDESIELDAKDGVWSEDLQTYSIPYANLADGKTYVVKISGFRADVGPVGANEEYSITAGNTGASLSPAGKNFGALKEGFETQPTQTFVFTNTGNTELTDLEVSLTGEGKDAFEIVGDTTIEKIAKNGRTDIKVRPKVKTPAQFEPYAANLVVSGEGISVSKPLSVTVVGYRVYFTPAGKDFGLNSEYYEKIAAQEFVLGSEGNGKLTDLAATLTGDDKEFFEISKELSGDEITSPGKRLKVSVRPKGNIPGREFPYHAKLTVTGDNGFEESTNISVTIRNDFAITSTDTDKDGEPILNTDYIYNGDVLNIKSDKDMTIAMKYNSITETRSKILVTSEESNITLDGVKIDVSEETETPAFHVDGGTLNLTLKGENELRSGDYKAGLQLTKGANLVITDESKGGSLTAVSGHRGAGIGGTASSNVADKAGNIEIYGGTINATGGGNVDTAKVNAGGAGIGAGSGAGGACGNITIGGNANITAAATDCSAGIGAGYVDYVEDGSLGAPCGKITINGGTVAVDLSGVPNGGAGIGSGNGADSRYESIEINGGTITAIGGQIGTGIGAGRDGAGGGDIKITGGNITAKGGTRNGAGIGAADSAVGAITITGGTVTATYANANSQDIGNASVGTAKSVTIDGGTVYATNNKVVPAPKNSVNALVYANKLTLGNEDAADNTAITLGSIAGTTCAETGENGVYGIKDVKTNDSSEVCFWLPAVADSTTVMLATATNAYQKNYVRLSALQSQTLTVPEYALLVNPIVNDFGKKKSGEAMPSAETFTITNVGTGSVGGITTALNAGNTDYEVKALSSNSLDSSVTATFTVQPKASLGVGEHNATLVITNTGEAATLRVPLKFEIIETTPPTVSSAAPTGTGALISGSVVITFSEPMNKAKGTVKLNDTKLVNGRWSNNTTYSIPYSGLDYSTAYTVNISGFKDVAENEMTAVTSGYTFTTKAAPDTTAPTVSSVTPTGTGSALAGNVVITFGEPMNTTAAGIVKLNSVTLSGGGWTNNNITYTIPYSGLDYSTEYTVNISGFEDVAENEMAETSGYTFTTMANPKIAVTGVKIAGAPAKFTNKATGIKTLQLTADVLPTNATSKSVTWKSSNTKIAVVNASGLVTFVGAEGSVIITATAADGSGKSAAVTINSVKNVTGIRTPLATVYIQKGKSLTLPVVLDDSTNKNVAVTSKLTWKSSNTKAVTVTQKGKITAAKSLKKKTIVKITVTAANGKSKVIKVIAVPKATKLTKVTAKMSAKNTLKVGKFYQLNVKLSSATATNVKVTFKSSKASVLKVDKAGKLIALKKGTATITIKAGSKSIKQKITVK